MSAQAKQDSVAAWAEPRFLRGVPSRPFAIPALMFVGLFAFYISLSPGAIAGMGYTGEEIQSGEALYDWIGAWLSGKDVPAMQWSRNGLVPIVFDLPFIAAARWAGLSSDFVLCLQPALLSAGLVTLLFLWLRGSVSNRTSLFVSFAGAFSTMIWPYAYIGLETKQSFSIFLAAYLCLGAGTRSRWLTTVAFVLACSITVGLKTTGTAMIPAIAWLIYTEFRETWRWRRLQLTVASLMVFGVWILASVARDPYWRPRGGGWQNLRPLLVDSPFTIFTNLIGVFGAPGEGLFVYAPVLILAIYAIPKTYATERPVAVFALILTAGAAFQIAIVRTVDEVWGPRYMHTAVVPLLLCIGLVRREFRVRRELPLLALTFAGILISFLGAFYYYGAWHSAATKAGQNTSEWLSGDTVWNPVRFNARLFETWLRGPESPSLWTPEHVWLWSAPPNLPPPATLDLRQFCQPQSFMLRFWSTPKAGATRVIFALYACAFALGIVALALTTVLVMRGSGQTAPAIRDGEPHFG